jgi:hypothetical protein
MPSSGGPNPYGWTTSSPSSPAYSLARTWHFGQEGGALFGAWWLPADLGRRPLMREHTSG